MESPEQAVVVTYSLSDGFGSELERDAVRALKYRLIDAIGAAEAGELDGTEFGGGRVRIYTYGPDAGRLFGVMEALLREFPLRPARAVLRLGAAGDDTAQERVVEL